jgi:hypothetical protein
VEGEVTRIEMRAESAALDSTAWGSFSPPLHAAAKSASAATPASASLILPIEQRPQRAVKPCLDTRPLGGPWAPGVRTR